MNVSASCLKTVSEYPLREQESTIRKTQREGLNTIYERDYVDLAELAERKRRAEAAEKELGAGLAELRKEMLAAAEALEFERAAALRDQSLTLEKRSLEL